MAGYRPLGAAGLVGCQCQECKGNDGGIKDEESIDVVDVSFPITKEYLIELYLRVRHLDSDPGYYSFDGVPEIIESKSEKFTLVVNLTYRLSSVRSNAKVGKWETSYRDFIISSLYHTSVSNLMKEAKNGQAYTTEDFIRKAEKRFPGQIGFDKAIYINNSTPVILKCLSCGEYYEISPRELFPKTSGYCGICIRGKKKYTSIPEDIFIEKLRNIYGNDFWDTSDVKYINDRINISLKRASDRKIFTGKPVDFLNFKDRFISDPEVYSESDTLLVINELYQGSTEEEVLQLQDISKKREPSFLRDQSKVKNELKKYAVRKSNFIKHSKVKFPDTYDLDFSKVKYVDSNTDVTIHCNIHDIDLVASPKNLLRGKCGCFECYRSLSGTSKKITNYREVVIPFLENINGLVRIPTLEEYLSTCEKEDSGVLELEFLCPTHGPYTKKIRDVRLLLKQEGPDVCFCNDCRLDSRREEIYNETLDKLKCMNTCSDYDFRNTKIVVKTVYGKNLTMLSGIVCNKCHEVIGDLIPSDIVYIISNGLDFCGCTGKNKSIGEAIVKKWFRNNDIDFVQNKRLTDIEGRVSDYVIPDFIIYNDDSAISTIIECDGNQHTEFIKFFHRTFEEYENQIRRDENLKKYCEKNNIRLIIIPYKYYNESDINKILSDIFINRQDPEIDLPDITLYDKDLNIIGYRKR